jgi:hypothetical protein
VIAYEAIAALLTDEQTTQQIVHAGKPRPIAAAVFLKLLRDIGEQRVINDCRHRHGNVLVGRRRYLAPGAFGQAVMPASGTERRPPGNASTPAIDRPAGIGGVQQQAVDHRTAPVRLAGRTWKVRGIQAAADPRKGQVLDPDPLEDLTHDPGLVLINLKAGDTIASIPADVVIAIRSA